MEVGKKSTRFVGRLMVIFFLILILQPSKSTSKRFDCRMFCKETGFHGMVGGCRCSFTLFTAKRDAGTPDRNIESDSDGQKDSYLMPDESRFQQRDLSRFPLKIPLYLQQKFHEMKRRELEQDMDNGDTKDFLRISY